MNEVGAAQEAGAPFPGRGGKTGALLRDHRWQDSGLGEPGQWPETFRTGLSLVLEAALPMALLWGRQGLCFYNDGYAPLLQARHPSAWGQPYGVAWPDRRDELAAALERLFAGGTGLSLDWTLALEREGVREESLHTFCFSPLRDGRDEVAGALCVCIEKTSGRLTQTALRASEARHRQIVDSATDTAIIATDLDGRITRWNAGARQILGWTEAEVLGRRVDFFRTPEDIAAGGVAAEMRRALSGGRGDDDGWRIRKDGSRFWAHGEMTPLRNEAGEPIGLVKVLRDRSEQRAADEALRRSEGRLRRLNETLELRVEARTRELLETEEALRQAQKMEAVGQLTGGIAHDFNNLLTAIVGSLDMLKRKVAQGRTDGFDRYVDGAMASALRAAGLIQRLLAFSRRQALEPRKIDVRALILGLEDLLARTISEAIRLEIVAAPDLWPTRCDPHQLESAILNLVINARDAMPDGGILRIESRNVEIPAEGEGQRGAKAGRYVRIAVADTGMGMPPDVVAKAFDPFFTTKPIGQGTGLGLSMIYGFVHQSGGAARIHSAEGKGTTVELDLPLFEGEADDAESGRDDTVAQEGPHRDGTVLVVEDEQGVRDLVVELLRERGYRVIEAREGAAGLEILESEERIDLLLSDVGLPGLNGRQLADAARLKRPDLKVLFITGYAYDVVSGDSLLAPGMEMLAKPFAMEALAARVQSMIGSPAAS